MPVNRFPQKKISSIQGNVNNIGLGPYNYNGYFWDTNPSSKAITLGPVLDMNSNLNYLIQVNSQFYKVAYSSTAPLKIDLNTTGVSGNTGGLVDGISFSNGRSYLAWGISNEANTALVSVVATRKPYSTFSAVSNGTKGSTTCSLTVTNGFQFTVGARVVIRNTSGTGPLFQYNWATITAVANTTLTLTTDNVSDYGTTINSATGGEVLQWNLFKPWVVTSTGQTLYATNFALLGELETNSSNGNVMRGYRTDDEYRLTTRQLAVDTANAVAAVTAFTMSRDIPLWSDQANFSMYMNPAAAAAFQQTYTNQGNVIITALVTPNNAFSAVAAYQEPGWIQLDPYAQLSWLKNNTVQGGIYILGYRVKGGMRL